MQEPVSEPFSDDEALAAALSRRSREALEKAYRRYAKPVFGVAYRLTGSATEAEEVLQDVFVGLPESVRSFEGRGSFEGWLTRVAARMALARNRTRKRRSEDPAFEARSVEAATGPGEVSDWVALERALNELSDPLRETFILKEVEGYTHREIADTLGIRVGASKVRLYRAKKRLRELLGS